MLDDSQSSIKAHTLPIEGPVASISPLCAHWETAALETWDEVICGTVAISISAASDLSFTIYSAASIDDGNAVARLQSTYVGYGEPLEWRAIHLPVKSAGTAIEDSPATRVRQFTTPGSKPELRFMILDHLHELRDMLAGALGAAVAIDVR